MRITVLAENVSHDPRLGAEHGLSLYLEIEGRRILFDMGQTGLFAENARVLGIDLAEVDVAVLSHGHYDHGGGLRRFLAQNDHAPVYVTPGAFEPHYHGAEKYIGLDTTLQDSPRLRVAREGEVIGEGLTLHACNDGALPPFSASRDLLTLRDGALIPDPFCHEQYLLVREPNGRTVLFTGCAHKGVIGLAARFRPDVLVGGFHFSKLPTDETLAGYGRALGRQSTAYYTCHCTGEEQFRFLRSYLPKLSYLSVGDVLDTDVDP
jgi:7,8-dihydropterin-6-yl-methyl-4-(beta-D-ribofuranosyl)aminobenzene 5'-phosphate synthase